MNQDIVVPIMMFVAIAGAIWAIRNPGPKRKRWFRRTDVVALASNADIFYKSRQWLTVRYKAIVRNAKNYPPFGMCVGCHRMFKRGEEKHGDHIKPRSKYPELALDVKNIQILCYNCNMGKGNHDETNWRDLEENLPWWRRLGWRRAA